MTDVAINQETKGFQTSAILRVASVASTYLLAVYIAHTFIKYLPFKFAPAADVNPIFMTLEAWSGLSWVEPDFRFFTGGVETLAAVLLFVLGLQLIAALLTLGITGTAFLLHLGPIGFDGFYGSLATEAAICFTIAAWITWVRRKELPGLVRTLLVDRILTGR